MRRRFVGSLRARLFAAMLALCLAALAACGDPSEESAGGDRPASEGELTTIRFSSTPGSLTSFFTTVAGREGFLADEGIELDVITLTSTNTQAAALSSGELDMYNTTVNTAIELQQSGIDARVISAFKPASNWVFVTRADSDIPVAGEDGATWEDTVGAFEGAVMGHTGPGSPRDIEVQSMLEAIGLQGSAYTPVVTNNGPPALATLTSGQVDVIYTDPFVLDVAAAAGIDTEDTRVVLEIPDAGPEMLVNKAESGFVMLDTFLAEHPDLPERFQRAMERTYEFIAGSAEDADALERLTTLGVEEQTLVAGIDAAEVIPGLAESQGVRYTAEQLDAAIQYAREYGELGEADLAPEDFVDPSAIQ